LPDLPLVLPGGVEHNATKRGGSADKPREQSTAHDADGDTQTTRVRVFYEGALTKYAMVVEMMDKTEKPPLVGACVLEETDTRHAPTCKETKVDWQELQQ
jgi:hypothetical protein